MGNIKWIRFCQVLKYGWSDARRISKEISKSRLMVFANILSSFRKYGIWSNQYCEQHFWSLSKQERERIGYEIGKRNRELDAEKQQIINKEQQRIKYIHDWGKEYNENRKFIDRYSDYHWETSSKLRKKRREAYASRYNMGEDCIVQYGVELCREHRLNGSIEIGNRVLLAKTCFYRLFWQSRY